MLIPVLAYATISNWSRTTLFLQGRHTGVCTVDIDPYKTHQEATRSPPEQKLLTIATVLCFYYAGVMRDSGSTGSNAECPRTPAPMSCNYLEWRPPDPQKSTIIAETSIDSFKKSMIIAEPSFNSIEWRPPRATRKV